MKTMTDPCRKKSFWKKIKKNFLTKHQEIPLEKQT